MGSAITRFAVASEGKSTDNLQHTSSIDANDTIVFDLSQSVMNGSQVSFPVYIISDDVVNAVDFSLMFDEANFSLDTIINLTAYLQLTYNYTQGTLYFTSYSLQDIDHNMPLISVSFNMLGHYLCYDDLSSMLGYLNGDPCSVKVVNCVSDGVNNNFSLVPDVRIYNESGITLISVSQDASMQLYDVRGAAVSDVISVEADQQTAITKKNLLPGIYLIKIFNDHFSTAQKVVIR